MNVILILFGHNLEVEKMFNKYFFIIKLITKIYFSILFIQHLLKPKKTFIKS